MPELPEAETIARALDAALRGARIARAALLRRDFLKTGSPSGLRRLAGRTISAVGRRGKCVVLEIPPRRLVLQLGMAGRVYVDRPSRPRPPHTHLIVALAGGREMRYANVRRIASGVHLLADGQAGPLGRLGPDADGIGLEEFLARIAARRTAVKTALLNQSILAGVGNIYAQEALFRAGIHPSRRANRVSRVRLAGLHRADLLDEGLLRGLGELEACRRLEPSPVVEQPAPAQRGDVDLVVTGPEGGGREGDVEVVGLALG